ncbi:MAG TPA: nucleotide sugar dehydrogenase [Phycisphaerae bacterium]|nr:nucleotide sugar dehydrogenase [Phycisphaerae bacterium]HOJ74392.1 nucleotide sugar dehydrogenase [Phycisphaerae bacterium]HOM52881.1 nucleotide sugar dehydrogenase [Phycisphaerae bacterium]HPP27135.1 nucleotide sugar dehydrogenase [Phycisphaerae bacterium]HPZ97604.1 nucleotide sugar dehydrogenase [Phycisphaerae bacterium]
MYDALLKKIDKKEAKVGILGMGYVGLPLAEVFCGAGFPTLGFDIDPEKVRKLNAGKSYIQHIPTPQIKQMRESGRFKASNDPKTLRDCDALIICVPTPLSKSRDPDMTYVIRTAETIAGQLRKNHLVVLESTTYPGTTREVLVPILEKTGLKAGKDFFVAFSPEREDPGRKDYTTSTIPKVVGGLDPKSSKLATTLYARAVKAVVPVSSCDIAEAAKIVENVYRCVNIAMVNELKMVFDRMGIDVWEVIEAAKTKPFGFQAFYPGPGLGGHCIPIDPFYLTWKARHFGMPTRFIELAGEINTSMPHYVVEHVIKALNTRKKAINGAKILVLGLAYKPNIDDIRESPSIELIELLKQAGAKVDYNDPHVPTTHKQREHDLRMKSVPLTPRKLAEYDCVVISTNHDAYDYQMIVDNAKLVVDTRNACAKVKGPKKNVFKA